MAKLGFIGAGNMACAIIGGIVKSGIVPPEEILVTARHEETCRRVEERFHVRSARANEALAQESECVLLCVKPVYLSQVLEEVGEGLRGKLVVSIVAGWDMEKLRRHLPDGTRVVRVMPNTPLLAGAGMCVFDAQHTATPAEYAFVQRLFGAAGEVCEVEPHAFEAATGISGCGPAFVYQFIEALADGGVRNGVPRKLAYRLAAQTVLGAGKMVLETGEHPGALKDAVCSPGGTTIEGVALLERRGMRAAVIDAVTATVEKTEKLK